MRFAARACIFLLPLLSAGISMPQIKTSATKPAVKAEWSAEVLEVLGVNREDFHLAGLDKLTAQQLSNLLSRAIEERAATASKLKTGYSCGAPRKSASEYDKVKVLISFTDDIDEQVKSGVLNGVRNIPDALIVYERGDADIHASILAAENKTNGGRSLGFSAALVYTDVCTLAQGESTIEVDDLVNTIFLRSASADGIVSSLVSNLDAEGFEHERRMNAIRKKSFVENGPHE